MRRSGAPPSVGLAFCLTLLCIFALMVLISQPDATQAAPVPQTNPTPELTPVCPQTKFDEPMLSDGTDQFTCTNPLGRVIAWVFIDANANRRYDSGEVGLPGVTVQLLDSSGNVVRSMVSILNSTGTIGVAEFLGVPTAGVPYTLRILTPPGYTPTLTTEYTVQATSFVFCCSAQFYFPFFPQTPPQMTVTPTPPPNVPPPPAPACVPVSPSGGNYVQLPVLGYVGNESTGVDWVIEAQNVGATWTKIALLLFQENQGFCQPQVAAPFKLECTGLLKPGSAWIWTSQQVSRAAKSAIAFSFNPFPAYNPQYYRCESLDTLRRTAAWPEGWPSVSPSPGAFPFNWNPFLGQPIALEVVRKVPGNTNASLVMAGGYSALNATMEGRYDPVFGGFAYYAPVVYSGFMGFNSWLYIQNSGSECSSIEIWFKAQDDCLRAQICEVLQIAPGYTAQFNVSTCVAPGFVGSAWIRASQPLGIVVDQIGSNVLMSYTGIAAQLCFVFNGQCLDDGGGAKVAYGPLIYREQQGWDTRVYVQNLSGVTAAKVKVYFLDHNGGIITTIVDWVCPRGEQTFFLPLVNNLPGQYVGQIRVESQGWESPGDPFVSAPGIAAVAELIQYNSAARTQPTQAIAYNLFPETQGYLWQLGAGTGGTKSGVGLIGIPSLLQRGNSLGLVTEIAIQNIVPKPGFTDFAIYIYDQNGLIDYVCEKLNEKQVEYIDLSRWGIINPGFKGSAVISAIYWDHKVFDQAGGYTRNLVGLAAVKIERVVPTSNMPMPGDVAAGSEAFPIPPLFSNCPSFDFEGFPVVCPGVPANCSPVTLVLTICPPNSSTTTSVYAGATVALYNQGGQLLGSRVIGANGQATFTGITSGQIYTAQVNAVRRAVPFPSGGVDQIDMPGFTAQVSVSCQTQANQVYMATITPPTGFIAGYLVADCSTRSIFRQREIQLWIPPSANNQGGTYLQSAFSNPNGYFEFRGLNPCIVYELKIVQGSVVAVVMGVLAGAENVQTGVTAGQPQKYIISDAAGVVCDVLPDPP
ncbi:MAG: hypothetical protein KIT87_13550 [Anaerolineae bacterium]|nr:hypothetical protein [Anaerolineae bacterium]